MKKILVPAIAFSSLAFPAMSMGCSDRDFKNTFMRAINGQKYSPAEVIVEVAAVHESDKPTGEAAACSAMVVTAMGEAEWVVIHAAADAFGSYDWWTTRWRPQRGR